MSETSGQIPTLARASNHSVSGTIQKAANALAFATQAFTNRFKAHKQVPPTNTTTNGVNAASQGGLATRARRQPRLTTPDNFNISTAVATEAIPDGEPTTPKLEDEAPPHPRRFHAPASAWQQVPATHFSGPPPATVQSQHSATSPDPPVLPPPAFTSHSGSRPGECEYRTLPFVEHYPECIWNPDQLNTRAIPWASKQATDHTGRRRRNTSGGSSDSSRHGCLTPPDSQTTIIATLRPLHPRGSDPPITQAAFPSWDQQTKQGQVASTSIGERSSAPAASYQAPVKDTSKVGLGMSKVYPEPRGVPSPPQQPKVTWYMTL